MELASKPNAPAPTSFLLNNKIIACIAVIQGLILTYLFRSADQNWWLASHIEWLVGISTFFLVFPLLVYLSATQSNIKKLLAYLIPFSLLLGVLGGYVESQSRPYYNDVDFGALFLFALTAGVATHHALIYIQHLCEGGKLQYEKLFKRSWYNAVLVAGAFIFSGILFGILHLGASLFSMLGIEIFNELLRKDWIIIPLLSLSLGLSITLFRQRIQATDNLVDTLQPLFKFLLPVLSLMVISILTVLPFTGLNKLWDTGNASFLMIWLQVLTLFFVNSVYQQERHETPYPHLINRVIIFSIALLPIFSALVFYGLWLRIDQYGLSVNRAWALLINLLISGFTLGYAIGIVKHRMQWLNALSKVNIAMGALLSVLMLAVNSPALNFNQLTANSQIARYERGDITFDELDFMHLRDHLGRPGYEALQDLHARLATTQPSEAQQLQEWIEQGKPDNNQPTLAKFKQAAIFWPEHADFPDTLIAHFFDEKIDVSWADPTSNYYFLAIDLNDDNVPEWVSLEASSHSTFALLWTFNDEQWQQQSLGNVYQREGIQNVKEWIEQNQVESVKPQWNNLKIGEMMFKVEVN